MAIQRLGASTTTEDRDKKNICASPKPSLTTFSRSILVAWWPQTKAFTVVYRMQSSYVHGVIVTTWIYQKSSIRLCGGIDVVSTCRATMKRDVMYAFSRLFYGHWLKVDKSLSSSAITTMTLLCVQFTDDEIKFGSGRSCGFCCIQRAIGAAATAAVRCTHAILELAIDFGFCILLVRQPTCCSHKFAFILRPIVYAD